MAVLTPLTAATLLRSVGLLADGPAVWGRPFAAAGPGVFIVELSGPLASAPIELTRVGKWIERLPAFRLDGEAPTSKAVAARLASFWIASTTVLYIGSSTSNIAGRVGAIEATVLGDRKPYARGTWLKTLIGLERTRLWWARTGAVEEYEDALFTAFAEAIPPDERARLHATPPVLPFANLRSTAGERKAHGLSGFLVPEEPAAPSPPTRVTELPPGDAEGASGLPPSRAAGGTMRRAPRAPSGSGAPRPAAPPPRAAPRSPAARPPASGPATRPADDATYLSPEGIARLREELVTLTTVKRPEVILRIKTAKELGDLKENADYTSAREEQSFLEGRIANIEGMLRTAVVIEAPGADGRVHLGSEVSVVEVEGDGEVVVYRIVGSTEVKPAEGRISNSSPVGRALIGRSVGEVVAVTTPRGAVEYRIVAID